ncbi:hypothetical protein PRVXT_002376 [Proteinivorax tanatarense]|uniref:Uncharacterized protein n=1 Tax=Proteinivorax tanatarense TaxID=1260629 RepID=A0AAU7VJX2_9FIRM
MEKSNESYLRWVHRFGRTGTTILIIYILMIPTIICAIYDIFPPISSVILGGIGVFALFIPIGIAEVLSYTPLLGSSCYLTFTTGNVLNLKLPCVINAMKIANVEPNTPEGDAISTVAVALSSILTILIIALGVILLVPLQPLLQTDSVQQATTYMLPALFGGLFLGFLGKGEGEYIVKRKSTAIILPVLLVSLAAKLGILKSGLEGVAIIVMLPITLLSARILWKKGVIEVEKRR